MAAPLKIKDNDGNIQQFTSTEENYIASFHFYTNLIANISASRAPRDLL